MTNRYRLLRGSHSRWHEGERRLHVPGRGEDSIMENLTAAEIEFFGDRVELVDGEVIARPESAEPKPEPEPTPPREHDQDSMHWTQVVKRIEDLTDAREVDEILDAERTGRGRRSVIEAAEQRLKDLSS